MDTKMKEATLAPMETSTLSNNKMAMAVSEGTETMTMAVVWATRNTDKQRQADCSDNGLGTLVSPIHVGL